MKIIPLSLFFMASSIVALSINPAMDPIHALTKRIMGMQAKNFTYEFLSSTSDADVFELESGNNRIVIRGNNFNSMAVGLSYYLKYFCKTSVSWYADDKVELPAVLPPLPNKICKEARVKKRFFLNYCTFGYSMTWWKWSDWERLIDWMALQGINMPLAITGQENIWYQVWRQFGLSDQEIRSYFTGPAHLPWHRMSEMDKWQGPLPMSWITDQTVLQKKILARERELGMQPVLPAFAGHVPEVIKNYFPKSKISKLSEWNSFEDKYRSYFLDPFDSLFSTIQQAFLKEQMKQFGTDHIYGIDPFNELVPPSWDTTYLASVSKTIYQTVKQTDKEASWLQMTWQFYVDSAQWIKPRIKSFLTAVPMKKMILLDYFCENTEVWKRTNSFFNQPFIWCYLGNFGGNTMMAGNIDEVENRMENALLKAGKNMIGIGATPEGFDVNPFMYEYVFEKAWSSGPVNVENWIRDWAIRRCGTLDNSATDAWDILHKKVYRYPAKCTESTLTNARPSLTGHGSWTTNNEIKYSNSDLLEAWKLLLKTGHNTRQTFQYDLANIGRQVLGNYFSVLRDEFTFHYKKKNLIRMKKTALLMLELLDDVDKLLATQSSFLLGKWLENAKLSGLNSSEKLYYENNARTFITTWGAQAQNLNDYGNRTWSGLLKGYYKVRWKMFTDEVIEAVENNRTFDDISFAEKVTRFEWRWTMQHEVYSHQPAGNTSGTAKKLYHKYASQIINNNRN